MGKRISQLTDAGALTGAELFALSRLSTTVTITATTISALASDNSYNDSGLNFVASGFAVGQAVKVTGFTGNVANNIASGVITALTTAKMTIGGADGDVIVDDAAGESVTITAWESVRTGSAALLALVDAADVTYSPADATDWDSDTDPGDVNQALDQLANRMIVVEGAVASGGVELRGLTFTSDTGSTADSDPGAGLLKWNHATQASATYLYVDDQTADGVNLDTFYGSLGASGFIYLQQSDDSTKWQLWKWTAAPTDGTGYWKFQVTLQGSGGSITDAKTVFCDFAGAGGGGVSDADDVTYTPTTLADWDGAADPGDVEQALDQLAERVTDLETGGGSGAGKHAIPIMAAAMMPRINNGCAALAWLTGATDKPDTPYLAFDASAAEYAEFTLLMPSSWNEGTVTFVPYWTHAATTTNFGVAWSLQAVAISNADGLGGTSYGTEQTSVDTGGTDGTLYIGPESSAITIAGTPVARDLVKFRLGRLPSNGGDTMAVDAYLIGVVLFITTDEATDS